MYLFVIFLNKQNLTYLIEVSLYFMKTMIEYFPAFDNCFLYVKGVTVRVYDY